VSNAKATPNQPLKKHFANVSTMLNLMQDYPAETQELVDTHKTNDDEEDSDDCPDGEREGAIESKEEVIEGDQALKSTSKEGENRANGDTHDGATNGGAEATEKAEGHDSNEAEEETQLQEQPKRGNKKKLGWHAGTCSLSFSLHSRSSTYL